MQIAIVDSAEAFVGYKMDNWKNMRNGNVKFFSFEQDATRMESNVWDIIFVSTRIISLPNKQRNEFMTVIKRFGNTVSYYQSALRDHEFFDDIKELAIELQQEEDNQ